MRNLIAIIGPATLLVGGLTVALAQSSGTYKGEIMDSACAATGSHDAMMKEHSDIKTAKDCTLGCIKNGAKFVLYDPATKTTYQLDNQTRPTRYAGQNVTIKGTLNSSDNTIHITSIKRG